MAEFKTYGFWLCVIVFFVLATFSFIVVAIITKQAKRLIDCGAEDEEIIEEFRRKYTSKRRGNGGSYVINVFLSLVFVAVFAVAMVMNFSTVSHSNTFPTLRVVQSGSMAEKYSGNRYLVENDLNDQFDTYDIVLTYKMPDEFDLELYDIVVYEVEETLVIHRIIAIEEPNEKHPDCRYFTLKGDASEYRDRFPVLYSQMRGIYRGEKVRYLGSFITFLQSFAGWICIGFLIGTTLISPLLDEALNKRRRARLHTIIYPYTEDQIMWEYVQKYGKKRRRR